MVARLRTVKAPQTYRDPALMGIYFVTVELAAEMQDVM